MHGPWYNTNTKHQGEVATEALRRAAEPLFVKYQVNLVMSGHVHTYERLRGVSLDGKCNDRAPVYITLGDGGNHEKLYDEWQDPQPPISAYRNGSYYGYGGLRFYNRSHALWQWLPNPLNGSCHDSVVLRNYALDPSSPSNLDLCPDAGAGSEKPSTFKQRHYGWAVIMTIFVAVLIAAGILLVCYRTKPELVKRYVSIIFPCCCRFLKLEKLPVDDENIDEDLSIVKQKLNDAL